MSIRNRTFSSLVLFLLICSTLDVSVTESKNVWKQGRRITESFTSKTMKVNPPGQLKSGSDQTHSNSKNSRGNCDRSSRPMSLVSLRYQRGRGRGARTVYQRSCARLMASGPPPQGLPHTNTLLLELQVSNHRHISIWENSQFWVYWKRKDSHNNTTPKDQFLDPFPNQHIEGTQPKFSPSFQRDDLLTWNQHSIQLCGITTNCGWSSSSSRQELTLGSQTQRQNETS